MRAILERDFLAEVSRPRSFWFRALAAALVSTVILFVIADDRRAFVDAPDRVARELFLAGSFSLLGLLALLTPPSVVGAILEERERQTLPLVLAAPGRPLGFAAAKLLARSGAVFAWALAVVVPLAVVGLLGGVSSADLGNLLLVAGGVVLELAAWAVWISSVTRRLATGAVLAYILPLLRWGLVALLCMPLFDRPRQIRDWRVPPVVTSAAWWAFATTPFPAALRMLDRTHYDRIVLQSINQGQGPMYVRLPGGGLTVRPPPVVVRPVPAEFPAPVYAVVALLLALRAVFAAGRRLEREAEPRTSLLARFKRTRRWLRSSPGTGNPMVWKESRLLDTAASRPLYYTLLALFILAEFGYLFFATTANLYGRELIEVGMGFTGAHAAVLGLVAAMAGAATMAHERSTGSLDLLRVSPLTPLEICRGKEFGTLRALGFLGLVPLVHLVVLAVAGIFHPVLSLVGFLVLLAYVLFWLGVGLVAGTRGSSVARAVSLATGAYGILLIGIPLAAMVLESMEHDSAEFLFGVWPPTGPYFAMETVADLLRSDMLYGNRYTYYGGMDTGHVSSVVCGIAFLILGHLLLLTAPRRLARRFESESETG